MKVIDRSLVALFCDDVRRETMGTDTLVGVRPKFYNAKKLPIQIPQICVYFKFAYTVDSPASEFELRVYSEDELLISNPAPSDFLQSTSEKARKSGDGFGSFTNNLRIIGRHFSKQTQLTASAMIDGEEYLAGRMIVREQRNEAGA